MALEDVTEGPEFVALYITADAVMQSLSSSLTASKRIWRYRIVSTPEGFKVAASGDFESDGATVEGNAQQRG